MKLLEAYKNYKEGKIVAAKLPNVIKNTETFHIPKGDSLWDKWMSVDNQVTDYIIFEDLSNLVLTQEYADQNVYALIEGDSYYQVDYEVNSAEGSQTFEVRAASHSEALEKFKDGEEATIVDTDIDVVDCNIMVDTITHTGSKPTPEMPTVIDGSTSDGHHTFDELYEYRKVYNAAFFNMLFVSGKYEVQKSERHSDGELCFGGGWFIVVADLPTGQISNHYRLGDWGLFKIPSVKKCTVIYDGHTPESALNRLQEFILRY